MLLLLVDARFCATVDLWRVTTAPVADVEAAALAFAAAKQNAQGLVQEDIRLVEARGAVRADPGAATPGVAAFRSRPGSAALGEIAGHQARGHGQRRRVGVAEDVADGHGNGTPDAIAAIGPGATGTALGQIAQENGVVDGRGRVILESETAADAIATGAAAGPGTADCRVNHHLAAGERDTPAVAQDAAAGSQAAAALPVALLLLIVLEATLSVPVLKSPPPATAELPLTLVPVIVVEPRVELSRPPPLPVAELPLTVQLVSVVVP